ncbi:MAG: response regulator [Candidatus Marinimicrobia bacterium]|nr:response regulator [Candidatus Neomarinimicrobiota bacterium]
MSERIDTEDISHLRSIGVGKKVLVIDDDKYARSISKKILTEFGYDVRVVEDGIKGLQMMLEFHPDVVLLDLMMPGISGVEVLEKKKKMADLDDIKVIMVSAYSEAQQVQAALLLGAVDYVIKPATPKQLVKRIVRALKSETAVKVTEEGLKKPLDGYTHLLLLSANENFHEYIRSGLPEIYKISVVDSIDDLAEYYSASFSEYILAEQKYLDIRNAGKLCSMLNSIDRNEILKPYLYYESELEQSEIDKYRNQGIIACIKKPEIPEDLLGLLNKTFEVNLIEVIPVGSDITILKRKPVDTAAAGKETARLVEEMNKNGVKKFIIDLSVLGTIELEEIEHLSKFSNHQTRMGIKVNFVITSEKVHKSFIEFIETANVSISDSVESAMIMLD